MTPRCSTKAIIIEDGRLLTLRCRFDAASEERAYLLPGGGQNKGETLEEALRREIGEETGAEVRVGELTFVREWIDPHSHWGDAHQVEFYFRCELLSPPDPAKALEPDPVQEAVEWIPLDKLPDCNIFPEGLRRCFDGAGKISGPVYWGNC